MDSLEKLQRRKAELKAQIEREREDLKKTLLEAREEIEPANLLKKAVGGLLDFSKNRPGDSQSELLKRLPGPLGFLADVFVKDPKLAFAIKLLAPVALKFLPKKKDEKTVILHEKNEKEPEKPVKSKIYGRLRRGISALRGHLKKAEKPDESTAGQTEI